MCFMLVAAVNICKIFLLLSEPPLFRHIIPILTTVYARTASEHDVGSHRGRGLIVLPYKASYLWRCSLNCSLVVVSLPLTPIVQGVLLLRPHICG